jgi:DNA-directed RNA polymerase subunit alpha
MSVFSSMAEQFPQVLGETMEQVRDLIASGQLDEAQQELDRQGMAASGDPNWHFLHGLLAERRRECEQAIHAFARAIELDETHEEARFRLAYNIDLRGDDEQAVALYEECTREAPVRVNALINLAVLYEDRGEYEAAARCLWDVLGAHPNHARARLFLKDIESAMDMYYDEDQERHREQHNAILETPVADFELSVRSRNCLRKMNINRLGDLLRVTETELLAYKNFGETSLNEIKAMLSQKGLRLGQAIEDPASINPRPTTAKHDLPHDASLEVLGKLVNELELSVRSRKCLQRLNISTVAELAMRTEAELLGTKNFGQTSLNEIKQRLKEHGLSLRSLDD